MPVIVKESNYVIENVSWREVLHIAYTRTFLLGIHSYTGGLYYILYSGLISRGENFAVYP